MKLQLPRMLQHKSYIGEVCVFHAKNKCTMEGGKYVSHTSTFCRDTHENKCLD